MFYLIIHLNDRRREEDVMLALAASGVLDAVVVPATSVAQRMADGVALFAGFRADLTAKGTYAFAIGALLPNQEAIDRLKEELVAAGLDFASGEAGCLAILPVVDVMGSE